jgi:hypothetical protein
MYVLQQGQIVFVSESTLVKGVALMGWYQFISS